MPTENRISIQIKPEELDTADKALLAFTNALNPYMIALTPGERKAYPKMSDKTYPFVEKTVEYTESAPEFLPAFLNQSELKIDFQAVKNLQTIFRTIAQIHQNLSDTIMLAGSEAYMAALVYYNSVKQAAKMNVPNAKPIYEDLRKRFEGQGKSKPENPEEEVK